MIDYVSGTLVTVDASGAVVDVSGIGLRVKMSARDISELPPVESPVRIFVRTLIRDDSAVLYAFTSSERRVLFNYLIGVPTVGPSTAIALISSMSHGDVVTAILSDDYEKLSSVQGIGKKTAQKIILELKDRLKKDFSDLPLGVRGMEGEAGTRRDVVDALVSLGFPRHHAVSTCSDVMMNLGNESQSVDNILRLCLKELGEKRRR